MGCRLEAGALMMPADAPRVLATAARSAIAIFDCEPVCETFALDEAAVAIVNGMSDLVDQDIVEIEISDRVGSPTQVPAAPVGLPLPAVHSGFDELFWARRPRVAFHIRRLDRVQV